MEKGMRFIQPKLSPNKGRWPKSEIKRARGVQGSSPPPPGFARRGVSGSAHRPCHGRSQPLRSDEVMEAKGGGNGTASASSPQSLSSARGFIMAPFGTVNLPHLSVNHWPASGCELIAIMLLKNTASEKSACWNIRVFCNGSSFS